MSSAPAPPPPRSVRAALAVYTERSSLVMVALGFSAALPYFLVFDTLSAWLRASGLSLEVIGFFSLVTLVSSFKFLWAPFIDRVRVPWLDAWLGHRRAWMLVCQGLIVLGLWLVSGFDPSRNLGAIAVAATLVGFATATQDIAIDAWRIEAAVVSRQGAMAAAYQWGYRVAMIVAGAVPLLLAETVGWNVAYAVMAALMAIGVGGVLAAPREAAHTVRPIATSGLAVAPIRDGLEWVARLLMVGAGALVLGSGLAANAGVLSNVLAGLGADGLAGAVRASWQSDLRVWVHLGAVLTGLATIALAASPLPGTPTRPGVYLASALADPLRDFFARYRSTGLLVLALICLYRIPDFVLNIMNPFYLDLGYSLVEIAEVRKVFGIVMTMFGVFVGGLAVARYGLLTAMVIGAFAGPLSNLLFIWLALQDHNLWALFAAIGLDNVAGGLAGTCLIAYMSSLTAAGFTATQYALFSSLYAIPGRLVASQSGRIVETAARWADDGALAPLTALFANRGPQAFATAVEKSGVSPEALGAGYVTFFLYSTLLGVFALGLAVAVRRAAPTGAEASAGASP